MAIKLVVSDVDGSICTNSVFYLSSGITMREFSTFDGKGFELLRRNDIPVVLVTQSDYSEIDNRAQWLGVPLYSAIHNKVDLLYRLADKYSVQFNDICFFGNDVNDLEAMKLVGLPACPHDAHYHVLEYAYENGCVMNRDGGKGAFRELVDFIILAQQ